MAYHDPYAFSSFASALPAVPAPVFAPAIESTEEKLAKLKKTLSGALEVIQERNGLQPRKVILQEPKTKVERIPVPQIVGYQFNAQSFVTQSVHETKEVKKQVTQTVQKPDGTFENQQVTVTTIEPLFNNLTEIAIQRIPKGQDVTEYCAEKDAELSKPLFEALKAAAESLPDEEKSKAIKEAFKKATRALWGDYPANLQAKVVVDSAATAPTAAKLEVKV